AQNHLTDKHLVVAASRPTTSKTRVVARGQQVVRIDEEVEDPIPSGALDQVLAALDSAMADADALVIEDYNKGVLTPAVIERAMGSTARARGTRSRRGWARRWRRGPRSGKGRCWPTTRPASRSPRPASPPCRLPRCWRCMKRSMISWDG